LSIAQVCTAPTLSKSEKIKELQKQAKVILPTGNHRTLPQRDKEKGNSKKMTKARLGLMPCISGF